MKTKHTTTTAAPLYTHTLSIPYDPAIMLRLSKMKKNQKKFHFSLDRCSYTDYNAQRQPTQAMAPNQRRKDKVMVRFWITAELHAKFKKLSDISGSNMSELLTAHIVSLTTNVKLTPEDYERIAAELREQD